MMEALVFLDFCVGHSNGVRVNFEKPELTSRCLGGRDDFKGLPEFDLFHCIDPVVTSLTGRTDHFVMFPKRGMWIKERKARS
jgi:hypothetical protein